MQTNEVKLYTKYKGKKVCFNSRKQAGMTVEGVATQVDTLLSIVVVTDVEGFPHAIDLITATQVH